MSTKTGVMSYDSLTAVAAFINDEITFDTMDCLTEIPVEEITITAPSEEYEYDENIFPF